MRPPVAVQHTQQPVEKASTERRVLAESIQLFELIDDQKHPLHSWPLCDQSRRHHLRGQVAGLEAAASFAASISWSGSPRSGAQVRCQGSSRI